jgi:hypothetical protein
MNALERIRRLFARPSPSRETMPITRNQTNQPDGQYDEEMELLCERAKGLCSDPWVANQIKVSLTHQDGRYSLNASPEEGLPYVRAASSILNEKLPGDLTKQFEAI